MEDAAQKGEILLTDGEKKIVHVHRVQTVLMLEVGWKIFKNVNGPDCCKPRNRMIQNKAASSATQTAANGGIPYNVSGKIDRNYNYNYREYLKKRCRIADYDLKNGRQFIQTVAGNPQRGSQAPCCTTDCSPGSAATVLTYKRSNWGFRKQGAVDNDLYIAKDKYLSKIIVQDVVLQA